MTVKELLFVFEEHYYTDVVISRLEYDCFTNDLEDVTLATWKHKEHDHWYLGQLNYFTELETNELEPYFNNEVKSFYVINEIRLSTSPCIYIEIK